jgi:hypothetical protein
VKLWTSLKASRLSFFRGQIVCDDSASHFDSRLIEINCQQNFRKLHKLLCGDPKSYAVIGTEFRTGIGAKDIAVVLAQPVIEPSLCKGNCQSRLRVMGGKTLSEYMFSELPQIADITGALTVPSLPETALQCWNVSAGPIIRAPRGAPQCAL